MATVLLLVIYAAFISLGLPDSVLGVAWPLMHTELGAPLSVAGLVNLVVNLGTVISSLLSQRLIRRFGTWRVTWASVILTSLGLLLTSRSHFFWALMVFALPLGLGAGCIDTALNSYVARHYNAMQMNLLHAFWGIGTIVAPILLSRFFESGRSWRDGYLVLALLQAFIFLIVLSSRRLWKDDDQEGDSITKEDAKVYSIPALLKVRGAFFSCLAFAFYTMEGTAMLWMASYLVFGKGLDASTAASLSSMVYLGITAGRIATAFIADRVSAKRMIQASQLMIALSIIALLPDAGIWLLYLAIFMIGFSLGPIYPAMVRQTVSFFHPSQSVGIMSLQMCFCYIGNMTIPPLYGLMSDLFGQWLLPVYLLVLLALQAMCTQMKNHLCAR